MNYAASVALELLPPTERCSKMIHSIVCTAGWAGTCWNRTRTLHASAGGSGKPGLGVLQIAGVTDGWS